jgi:predicted MFS family arabinose efflux permease
LLPGRLLAEPNVRTGALASFVNTATTSSAVTLVTLYLQDHLGRSPLLTAATLLPFSLLVVAGSALAARLLARLGPNPVIGIGLVAIAVSDAALCLAADRAGWLVLCVAVSGAGIGLSSVAATRRGTTVSVADRGAASGLINTAAQLGTAVGIAVLVLVAATTGRTPAAGVPAPAAAWLAAAGVALLAGVGFLRPPWRVPSAVAVSTGRRGSARAR